MVAPGATGNSLALGVESRWAASAAQRGVVEGSPLSIKVDGGRIDPWACSVLFRRADVTRDVRDSL
jgi:hypothetical protein